MKNLFKKLLDIQNFGFTDEYKIEKRKELFKETDKLLNDNVKVYCFRVNYSYFTKRKNFKENCKIIVLNINDKDEAKMKVIEEINNFNNKYPYKAISNVKILGIDSEDLLIPLR